MLRQGCGNELRGAKYGVRVTYETPRRSITTHWCDGSAATRMCPYPYRYRAVSANSKTNSCVHIAVAYLSCGDDGCECWMGVATNTQGMHIRRIRAIVFLSCARIGSGTSTSARGADASMGKTSLSPSSTNWRSAAASTPHRLHSAL